jgi:hypothetical protein
MSRKIANLAAIILIVVLGAPVFGQSTNLAPLEAGPLNITVTAIQGGTQFRPDGQSKWQTLTAGAQLAEGVEFRTGPKGAIQFTVGTDQVYRVDRLTVVKVLRANLGADGTIKTDVGMEYGRVSKDVDAPVRPHDDTIVTPSSTLAVRGTRVSLYDQPPYEPEAVSLTGAAVFQSLGNTLSAFGAKNQGTAAVSSNHPDAAGNALNSRIVDPSSANARTPSEQTLLPDVIGNGAVINVNNPDTFPTVSNTGFPSTGQLKSLYPGDLVFYIRWDTNTHVELSLRVTGVQGEYIQPVLPLGTSPSGGHILFDNLGGPTGGYEVIVYPNLNFPDNKTYNLEALNVGSVPTTVTFDAFINGSKLNKNPVNGLIRLDFINVTDGFLEPVREVTEQALPNSSTASAVASTIVQTDERISTFLGPAPTFGTFAPTVTKPRRH